MMIGSMFLRIVSKFVPDKLPPWTPSTSHTNVIFWRNSDPNTAVPLGEGHSISTGAQRGGNNIFECLILGFRRRINEIFAILSCYTVWIGSYRRFGIAYRFHFQGTDRLPKRRQLTVNQRCVTIQKSEDLTFVEVVQNCSTRPRLGYDDIKVELCEGGFQDTSISLIVKVMLCDKVSEHNTPQFSG
jgi:hypothetical protein